MLLIFIALVILIIDQLSKLIVLNKFLLGESVPVIKGIFHLSLVFNKGVAFGMFSQTTHSIFIWLSYISVLIIVFILYFGKKFSTQKKTTQISLSLILAGAIGNLIDRIRFGYVIDFLDFRIWPVFNVADAAITIGTLSLILQIFKYKKT